MAGVPANFQALSNVIANYDYVDIASGTGFITLYAGTTVDLKLLSNNSYYSNTIYETATGNAAAATLVLDHDFDILLNRPLDLRGTGIVNIPVAVFDQGINSHAHVYATVILRKWDGVTETDIVTNVGTDYEIISAAGTWHFYMSAIDLVIPLTHFKQGETLRLTVNLYAYTTGASDGYSVRYAHDPQSRSSDWDTTGAVPSKLVLQCPVRLNL
jgi:hypothetical protein